MVLGLFDSVPYAEGSVTLASGDVLVIYSDGVTEAWNEADEEFGEAGVARVAGETRHECAETIHTRLLAAVDDYEHGKAADDRTLIVLKRD
jgi:sigma-B regulation protein RsbU (phosphoserine phosphatase)